MLVLFVMVQDNNYIRKSEIKRDNGGCNDDDDYDDDDNKDEEEDYDNDDDGDDAHMIIYTHTPGVKKSLVLEPGTSLISSRTSVYFHPMSGGQVKNSV